MSGPPANPSTPNGVAVGGFLLAGGKSSRMGRDKALLPLEGETLAERGLRKLRQVCREVSFAGGAPELERFAPVIPDRAPGCGPLGGIVSALEQTQFDWNLFLAVDMPFVPVAALERMLLAPGGGAKLFAAEVNGIVQPLCGLYSRRALPMLQDQLRNNRLKLKDAIAATCAVCYVPFYDLDWFRNVNTPDEFRAARQQVGE